MKSLRAHPVLSLSLTSLLVLGSACAPTDPVSKTPPTPRALVKANASVDKAVGTTGDLITFAIAVDHDRSLTVTVPDIGDAIAGFRIIDFGQDPPKREGERRLLRRWYTLRGDLVGSYILPALTVPYTAEGTEHSVTTSEIFVEIQSVLPTDGSAKDIRGLKPLRRVHPTPRWPLYAGIAFLLTLVGLGAFFFWRRARQKQDQWVAIPPHEVAFDALSDLRTTDFSNPKAVRRYYFAISGVLRTYIEGRFAFNATDLTTEELLPQIGALVPPLHKNLRQDMSNFFISTDTVKFAGHTPTSSEIEVTYETALSFVESTLPKPTLEEESSR